LNHKKIYIEEEVRSKMKWSKANRKSGLLQAQHELLIAAEIRENHF